MIGTESEAIDLGLTRLNPHRDSVGHTANFLLAKEITGECLIDRALAISIDPAYDCPLKQGLGKVGRIIRCSISTLARTE